MKSTVSAHVHFFLMAFCVSAAVTDMVREKVTIFTIWLLLLGAVNVWLGFNRLEGK